MTADASPGAVSIALRRARTFLRLPLRTKARVVHAALLFAVVEVLLKTVGTGRTAKVLGVPLTDRGSRSTHGERPFSPDEHRSLHAVRVLAPRFYGTERGCLRRSLVLGRLLRHRGVVLRIGARRGAGGELLAHAWLDEPGAPAAVTGYVAFSFDDDGAPQSETA